MKIIKLTRGYETMVDNEDFEELSRHSWHAMQSRIGIYACRGKRRNRIKKDVRMHNQLMNPPPGKEVDHIDGNSLNNQKSNLRICTHSENCWNRKKSSRNKSGFTGVRISYGSRWRATITSNGKTEHLGTFSCAEDAARAWDNRAIEIRKRHTLLNFPEATNV